MTLVHHPRYHEHRQTPGHPESPERLDAVVARLKKEGLWKDVLEPGQVEPALLRRVHSPAHVDSVRDFGEGYLDPDTYVRPQTYEIALLAAGGTVLAAREALSKGKAAFALVRPPGHHAGSYHGGGFCYFNNVAIAAEALLERVDRVAVVDIDLHHGNGTNDIFYEREDVLYISSHQQGIFPGTGRTEDAGGGAGAGFNINVPLPGGSGDGAFELLVKSIVKPVLNAYRPEALLVSFGGDAHYRDPLGGLSLSSSGYIALSAELVGAARRLCGGAIAFSLEGGYHVGALAEVVAGTVAAFEGKSIRCEHDGPPPENPAGKRAVERAVLALKRYWPVG